MRSISPRLADSAWPDVGTPIIVVPVGSCEQHGPHLPLDTDVVIAEALAHSLCRRRPECRVAPSLAITASGEHEGFAGTLSIGDEVMRDVVVEIVRSAGWSSGVVLVNGHGGNLASVKQALDLLAVERRRVLAYWPKPSAERWPELAQGDLHAGHLETSLMLHLAPDRVQLSRAVAGSSASMPELIRAGVQAVSGSGVLGDPTGATAAAGGELFAALAEQLDDEVGRWIDRWR